MKKGINMKQLENMVNKILAKKMEEQILIKEKDLELIFVKALTKLGKKNKLDFSNVKNGKIAKAFMINKDAVVSPFFIQIKRESVHFIGRQQLTYSKFVFEDNEIENVLEKTYETVIEECNSILEEKSKAKKEKKEKLQKEFDEILESHNMSKETFYRAVELTLETI